MAKQRPFHLIDDFRFGRTGWDIDNRGAGTVYGGCWVTRYAKSIDNGYATTFDHPLTVQKDGEITVEFNIDIISGDGFYIGMFSGDTPIVLLKQSGESFTDGEKELFCIQKGFALIKLSVNLDNGTAAVSYDGIKCKILPKVWCRDTLTSFRYGYGKEDVGEAQTSVNIKMYKNYVFNDECVTMHFDSPLPDDYVFITDGNATATAKQYSQAAKNCVYSIKADKKLHNVIEKAFNLQNGFAFEVKYLNIDPTSTVTFGFFDGEKEIVSVSDNENKLFCDNVEFSHHSQLVWQYMRFVADKDTGNFDVYQNGVKRFSKKIPACLDTDSIKIIFDTENEAEMCFTDFKLFEFDYGYEDDYVPKPVKPLKTKDVQVGINVCSLWRGAHHDGWDNITPFKEIKPLMGFYDEGIPETADWEIKWLAEHGVDFELYCWYASFEPDVPFVNTSFGYQLDYAHKYAKYSDEVKIALLWEPHCAFSPSNFESFKKHYVPYWIDHYFSDPRYYTIDGKAFMSIYNPFKFINNMGGAEKTKEALKYLRSEVKKLGYEDLIVTAAADPKSSKLFSDCGFDACEQYGWGRDCSFETTRKNLINAENNSAGLHFIPTISTGFSSTGWHKVRFPNASAEDFEKSVRFSCDEILDKLDVKKGEEWKKKMLVLSNWNEYGEGTYIMPSEGTGFGYLDGLKNVIAPGEHEDVIPNDEQRSRFCILHPKDREILAPHCDIVEEHKPTGRVLKKYEFKTKEDLDLWEFHNISHYGIKNGLLCGSSDSDYPYMVLKDKEFLPFPANSVSHVRITGRAWKNECEKDCIVLFASGKKNATVATDEKHGALRINGFITDPDKIKTCELKIRQRLSRTRSTWDGEIFEIRIDPIYAKGNFELESIEFMEAEKTPILYIDGEICDILLPIVNKNGEYLIPFDTQGNLVKRKELAWKWQPAEKTLYLYGVKDVKLTVDSSVAVIDNKAVTLKNKTELFDNVPLIPLHLFAELLGKKAIIDDNILKIK